MAANSAWPTRFFQVMAGALVVLLVPKLGQPVAAFMTGALLLLSLGATAFNPSPPEERLRVPTVAGGLPLLGNALQYKSDPVAFLCKAASNHGGVFRLSLPGFGATVLCDKRALRCFALAPESELSAVDATEALGFGTTLGPLNVRAGTAVHRSILKSGTLLPTTSTANTAGELRALVVASVRASVKMTHALQSTCSSQEHCHQYHHELFAVVRESVLRATAAHLLGEPVIASCGVWFFSDFTRFQDRVEAATARAMALPPWLAQTFVLGPVQRHRKLLAARLAPSLALHWGDVLAGNVPGTRGGAWLRAVHAVRNHALGEGEGGSFSAVQIADLACGLLFAAHKNAAIAVAQSVAMLLERPTVLRDVVTEARAHNESAGEPGPTQCPLLCSVLHETLRLSAHTIGAVRRVRTAWFAFETDDGRRYAVPRGAFVTASHVVPHLLDAAFPSASEYRADRFIDGDGVFMGHCLNPFTLTTFSHGTHACPGQRYALHMMRAALWTLLTDYDVSVLPQQPLPPISFERATLAQRQGPCHVKLTTRHDNDQ